MTTPPSLLEIATVFLPLSFVTIGGGQTIVADIHRQVVDVHQWMTASQFLDAFAMSRMAPGPGSLLVTLIGWQVAGLSGALVATLSIFGPPAIAVFLIARAWARFKDALWQRRVEAGLRPVAAGMILGAVYVLLESLEGGWAAIGIALASTALLMTTKLNPIVVLGLGAAAFVGLQTLGLTTV